MQDPRFQNELPKAHSLTEYLNGYTRQLTQALGQVSSSALDAAYEAMVKTHQARKRFYAAGNGGSAAIADHLCCDWMKGTHVPHLPAFQVVSLVANAALFTAAANDFGYEQSLSKQIEMLAEPGDLIVLISSSGKSPNIIAAAEAALGRKMTVVGLSGFGGGKLKELSTISLHVPAQNYGIVEDAHQVLMHVLAQYVASLRDKG